MVRKTPNSRNHFINPPDERLPPQPLHLLSLDQTAAPIAQRKERQQRKTSIATDGETLSVLNQQVVASLAVAAQRTLERYLNDVVAKASAASWKKSSLFGSSSQSDGAMPQPLSW